MTNVINVNYISWCSVSGLLFVLATPSMERYITQPAVRQRKPMADVTVSLPLVQTEISQQLLDGLPRDLVQTFMVPRG